MSSSMQAHSDEVPLQRNSIKRPPQTDYSFEADPGFHNIGWYGTMMNCLGSICGGLGMVPCLCCFPNPFKEVNQGHVGLVTRFGKFYKCVNPGLVKVNPLTESVHHIDIKMQIIEIPKQIIMTKDNVNVRIDSVVYWHIENPFRAEFGVRSVRKALTERTQTTLRHILGSKTLQDCIENREAIAKEIQDVTKPVAKQWGVKIESILIKDLQLSEELQESVSAAAQAKRIGNAKVISARAEVDSAKLMRAAADILSTPAAMQIRYLETMQTLSKSSGTRIVFLPSDADNQGGGGSFGRMQAAAYQELSNPDNFK
ncbi:hypothetical protein BDB00DRAFT_803200 [Zychaea mexicana]|uniref:uncharacterized protein n=1 Tax=Zychaea mexicana TaxID=64656 RepID=UPI0022FE37D1|nr:uncharacterized protein BDB00DRAFT_803200 [Zychaea mexicana]KAI9497573.1 hypothetical protein BDB00DRAFT_803200 [Zychaea mexicana]